MSYEDAADRIIAEARVIHGGGNGYHNDDLKSAARNLDLQDKAKPLPPKLPMQDSGPRDIRLNRLANEIAEINIANGWFAADRSFGDEIALIHSEASEAYEEFRNGYTPGERYYGQASYDGGLPKPEGIPSELADIIVRVLDTCYRYGIDIDAVMAEKLAFNRTRGYRHGGKTV